MFNFDIYIYAVSANGAVYSDILYLQTVCLLFLRNSLLQNIYIKTFAFIQVKRKEGIRMCSFRSNLATPGG